MNPRALRLHVERLHSSKRGKSEKEIEKEIKKTRKKVEFAWRDSTWAREAKIKGEKKRLHSSKRGKQKERK